MRPILSQHRAQINTMYFEIISFLERIRWFNGLYHKITWILQQLFGIGFWGEMQKLSRFYNNFFESFFGAKSKVCSILQTLNCASKSDSKNC